MIDPLTITDVAGFFERLDQFNQIEAGRFMTEFNAFKSRYEDARERAEIDTRQSAPGFNIFRFLGVQRQEKFHSDFITYLLNPRESHAQGHLFLQTFFQMIHRKHPSLPLPDAPMNHGSWLVRREVITQDGNLDIYLCNPSIKLLFVIENKVDAGEQPDQLMRYAKYLERQNKEEFLFRGLLFLTPDGHSASTVGDKKNHHQISYRSDIRDWLKLALSEVQAATVSETVRQYLHLIQHL